MEEWECGIHVDSKWIEFAIIIIKTEIKIQTPAAARRTFAALCRRCWRRCQCCGRRRRRHHRHRRSRELLLAVCLLLWKPAKFHLIGMPLPLPLPLLSSSFYFCFFFCSHCISPLLWLPFWVSADVAARRSAAQLSRALGFFGQTLQRTAPSSASAPVAFALPVLSIPLHALALCGGRRRSKLISTDRHVRHAYTHTYIHTYIYRYVDLYNNNIVYTNLLRLLFSFCFSAASTVATVGTLLLFGGGGCWYCSCWFCCIPFASVGVSAARQQGMHWILFSS